MTRGVRSVPLAGPQHFEADDVYCVYCHAPAAGSCASCQALVCGDCAELVTGSGGRSFAVCRRCDESDAGRSLLRGWFLLLWPFALGAGALAALLWILRT